MTFDVHTSGIKRRPLLALVLLLALIDVILFILFLQTHERHLTVAFLNVGQGDAVFVEAPNGNQLLYDAGPPSGAVLRELNALMSPWDRSIDMMVFSHPDLDHIGGSLDVLRRYKVDVVLESGASSTNSVFQQVEDTITRAHIPRIIARRGMTIDMGDGVFADVLYPDVVTAKEDTNDASIVMLIHYGSTSFMVSGDLPQSGEFQVLALDAGKDIRVDVLKLGHHGSRTSSASRWLSTLEPKLAIISAGLDNRYGHPHKEVLDLLAQLNIPFLTTFTEGTIVLESDKTNIIRK